VGAEAQAGRADRIIVDQADRRSSSELLAVLGDVFDGRAAAVLIEGGTMPRLSHPNSRGLLDVGPQLAPFDPPAGGWDQATPPVVAQVARAWTERRDTLMLALGVDEARFLNSAARHFLANHGELTGPVLQTPRRAFQAGDRVIALGRLTPDAPAGHGGQVVEVRPRCSQVMVAWDRQGVEVIDRSAASRLGYGYAVTPAVARWTRQPLVLLGTPDAVPRLRDRVVHSLSAASGPELGQRRAAGIDLVV
jgi:hypothetical protein